MRLSEHRWIRYNTNILPMIEKKEEKSIAIKLRREGKTYSEILSVIPVTKSTLSIWLGSVDLSKKQKQRTTAERLAGLKRGGEVKRKQRIERQNNLFLEVKSEISNLSHRDLFLIGVVLCWAEGSKEKEGRPGSGVAFSNMDSRMIMVFLEWLDKICKIPRNMITFEIMVHKSHKDKLSHIKRHWSEISGFPETDFSTVYWKSNRIKTNRKNTKEKYNDVLKVKVKQSSNLVRKIAGWSEAVFENVLEIKDC